MNIFKNLYNYRELLKTNVQKEIRGKYKHSFLGVMWSFLNPLLQIAIYAIVFPIITKNTQENYGTFLCVAMIPWTFFVTVVTQSTGIVINNANIVKKVYFPREILPISVTTSAAVNFIISTIIILAFVIISGVGLSPYLIFYPIIFIVQYLLCLGVSLILSAITVYLRDLEHLIGVAMQLLFFATPIVYSAETIEGIYKTIIYLNPMAHLIDSYRDIFFYKTMPNFTSLGILFAITIMLCVIGYMIFNKLQRKFAEEI